MSEQTEQFKKLLKTLSSDDIRWLISESNARWSIPPDTAPVDLITNKMVTRTMIKSGRNPEYGYSVTHLGRIFAWWVETNAITQYLDKTDTD